MPQSTFSRVPAGLGETLTQRGFSSLTDIQQAVVDAYVRGRDTRIRAKTGSGKTVALGMLVAEDLRDALAEPPVQSPVARPLVLMVAPTRELAVQLGEELSWLFASLNARVGTLTGGTSLENDFRMLRRCPPVLVATPGRLTDHMRRGTIRLDDVRAVALDEADEILDMGFEEDVTTILGQTPDTRRTHLLSATFPDAVEAIAARYQSNPLELAGSPAGEANTDITHHTMVVYRGEQLRALLNVLLMDPARKTLVFVRTRADAAELAGILINNGFAARALSGELSQRERTATLSAFKIGGIAVLVATDVAARGLDVHDISQVVHVDMPENAEVLTHRSGRTGRAGRKGTSILFVPPRSQGRAKQLLRQAGMVAQQIPIPTPDDVHRAADARLMDSFAEPKTAASPERFQKLADRLLESHDARTVIARLLEQSDHSGPCEPRIIESRKRNPPKRERPERERSGGRDRGRDKDPSQWASFQVSWGSHQGADPRRMLAFLCRRGQIDSGSIGAISIGERSSRVEVLATIADQFAEAASKPDPRDPRIKIRRWQAEGARPGESHPRSGASGDARQHASERKTARATTAAPGGKPPTKRAGRPKGAKRSGKPAAKAKPKPKPKPKPHRGKK